MTVLLRGLALPALALAACADQRAPAVTPRQPHVEQPAPLIVSAREAVHTANIAEVDPSSMTDAEVAAVLDGEARCSFSYSRGGRSVLSVSIPETGGQKVEGVVKINAHLARLTTAEPVDAVTLARGALLEAEGVRFRVRTVQAPAAPGRNSEAELVFETDDGLSAGYRGWYRCGEAAS